MSPTFPAVALVILDGWGLAPPGEGNAIDRAETPVFDELWSTYPHTQLIACGTAVGLPEGQMGNSEVGHLNLGAGAVVKQDLTRIDESLVEQRELNDVLDAAMSDTERLHLVGLVSDGGVHSSLEHLEALVDLARDKGVADIVIHAFTDGRDTSPTAGAGYLERVESWEGARVGTVVGRYYGMDRDNRGERTAAARDLLVDGVAEHHAATGREAVEQAYARDETDEFIIATTVGDEAKIRRGDSVLTFNFRPDRMRQIVTALAQDVGRLTTLTEYDEDWDYAVAFPPSRPETTIASVIAETGGKQLHVAETEKYPHVTYFFNGGEERPYEGEDRILVPSPNVATYDLQPEMSARGIAGTFVRDVERRAHGVIICNFANADMVGHTGSLDATVRAVETLDECLGRMAAAMRAAGGRLIVTADHGNAEQMWDDELNAPHTAHTSNLVPVMLVDFDEKAPPLGDGALCDVAPTILGLLGLPLSEGMTGRDLRG